MVFDKLSKLQHFLPHHFLSRAVANLADSKIPIVKNSLIKLFIKSYNINIDEAQSVNLEDYSTFNDFFTRKLKPETRPIMSDPDVITCPADGFVIQSGKISEGKLLQAKSTNFKLSDLLSNEQLALNYLDGDFMTIYLSPRDYHRVHMPITGKLLKTIYIPGKLFSVNYQSVQQIPDLFCRNERLICLFETKIGEIAVILVGAMLVAGIETVWGDKETPCGTTQLQIKNYTSENIQLAKGEELGHFRYGSTVIVLFGPQMVTLDALYEQQVVKVGQRLASIKMAKTHDRT